MAKRTASDVTEHDPAPARRKYANLRVSSGSRLVKAPKSTPRHHYDLLDQLGYKAESVLIVSPYVEREFFKMVAKRLKAKRVTVVIDDGCRAEDVKMIRDVLKGTKVQIALGTAPGLVHLKVFYIRWKTADRGEPPRTFVWGSGNATQQAFRGDINAELMCRTQLTPSEHPAILEWVRVVATKADEVESGDQKVDAVHDAKVDTNTYIRLPAMTLRSAESKATTYDLWLQRGRVVAAYRPDPGFLRVLVPLRTSLPKGPIGEKIAELGYMPSSSIVGVPYIKSIRAAKEPKLGEDGGKRWRSPLCVWTALGEWCSDACYKEKADCFRAANHEDRCENLDNLELLRKKPDFEQAKKNFLYKIRGLWAVFGQREATTYLECKPGGHLNEDYYAKLFANCVERDLVLSSDPEFRRHYVNGCEVSDVPRFRQDTKAWESFVQSFSRSLCKEATKPSGKPGSRGSQSRLLQRLRSAIGGRVGTFLGPTELTEFLRQNWVKPLHSGMTLGEYMDAYQNYVEKATC